jgi:uncharacterized protein YwgA
MTDQEANQDKVREQINKLAEHSYNRGFRDAQSSIADVFDSLDANNQEANQLYREIAKVIRKLQLLEEDSKK